MIIPKKIQRKVMDQHHSKWLKEIFLTEQGYFGNIKVSKGDIY